MFSEELIFEKDKRRVNLLLHDYINEPWFYNILIDNNAFIAGGFLTSYFTKTKVNDIDIFFRKKEDLVFAIDKIKRSLEELKAVKLRLELEPTPENCLNAYSFSCISLKGHPGKIQLISREDSFSEPPETIRGFDFTVCMIAFDLKTQTFISHPLFLKDLASKTLNYQSTNKVKILSHLFRIIKYEKKGFKIDNTEYLKMCLILLEQKFETIGDVVESLSGIYLSTPNNFHSVIRGNKEPFSSTKIIQLLNEYRNRE